MATCIECDSTYDDRRFANGYEICLECGEKSAQIKAAYLRKCLAPLYPKGAYQLVTDVETARNINSRFTKKSEA